MVVETGHLDLRDNAVVVFLKYSPSGYWYEVEK